LWVEIGSMASGRNALDESVTGIEPDGLSVAAGAAHAPSQGGKRRRRATSASTRVAARLARCRGVLELDARVASQTVALRQAVHEERRDDEVLTLSGEISGRKQARFCWAVGE
jgi:hypothetical protein